jgi:hypothetical protein
VKSGRRENAEPQGDSGLPEPLIRGDDLGFTFLLGGGEMQGVVRSNPNWRISGLASINEKAEPASHVAVADHNFDESGGDVAVESGLNLRSLAGSEDSLGFLSTDRGPEFQRSDVTGHTT